MKQNSIKFMIGRLVVATFVIRNWHLKTMGLLVHVLLGR